MDDESLGSTVAKNTALAGVKIGIGQIPIVGPAIAEALSAAVAIPAERKQIRFAADVIKRLELLEEPIDWETLKNDEGFSATVIHVCQAVNRTASERKLDAFANALVNSTRPSAPDETIRNRFVRFVDEMCDWHLLLLRYFSDPKSYAQEPESRRTVQTSGSIPQAVSEAFPEMSTRMDFVRVLVADLQTYGLLPEFSFGGILTASGVQTSRTTTLGLEFLAFISKREATTS
jgi:hypothetical protein